MRENVIFRVDGHEVHRAMREAWMVVRDLQFTLVCGTGIPPTDLEMEITTYFDKLFGELYWTHGIKEEIKTITAHAGNLVLGRVPGQGQRSVQALTGEIYDKLFKDSVESAMQPGGALDKLFTGFGGRASALATTPRGAAGPDVVLRATNVAWDVTTFSQIDHHFMRDVVGRQYSRYYLLTYDSPGAVPPRYIDWQEDHEEVARS